MRAHTAVTDLLLGESVTAEKVKSDITTAPVSIKMKALLSIASEVQRGGRNVNEESIAKARENGATDIEIHDTVLIAALFCLYNRYVDGLATVTPADPDFYKNLAGRIAVSYNRLPQGYDHLKKK
jgi:alkylhydroperoxidase/carboxymuconolactone decarboxylase family protein YurZ